MTALLLESLDRTFRLMRDDLRDEVTEDQLLEALTGTDVVLIADAASVSTHAGQCGFITAALLMARSGHQVYLMAPDVPLVGLQPPLKAGGLITSLLEIGSDLLPGVHFSTAQPRHTNLAVVMGNSPVKGPAAQVLGVNATAWSAELFRRRSFEPWAEAYWPYGALAAGALAAGEAFKIAMMKLESHARAPGHFRELFAPTRDLRVELAPARSPRTANLDYFDLVSAGAITNAALYCLARIPQVTGSARLIEDSTSDHSNLNRYSLLRASDVGHGKSERLGRIDCGDLRLVPIPLRYDTRTFGQLTPLAPCVLVGVDHIPSRWLVQSAWPQWLGVGATSHYNAMSSFHTGAVPCARCAHPRDDEAGETLIPTVAFVSFWAGLLLATQFVGQVGAGGMLTAEQQVFMTPVRPESIWRGGVGARPDCPLCGGRLDAQAA